MLKELCDHRGFEEIRRRLILIGNFKYRVRDCDAEDIAQTALTAYCEHRERYRDQENQMAILVGIFQKKCLEYIDHACKTTRRLQQIARHCAPDRDSPFKPERGGTTRPVIDQVIRREDAGRIADALGELKPQVRELFELLVEEGVGRRGLIERYSLKPDTLDSRIRAARLELRTRLKAKGICI